MNVAMVVVFIVMLVFLVLGALGEIVPLFFAGLVIAVGYLLYFWCKGVYLLCESIYFKSKEFASIKKNIKEYVDECNELNLHIEDLKRSYSKIKHVDYGRATYIDKSRYKFKRPELKKIKYKQNVYQCSLSVCKNAQQQPFKYVCKYFNIAANEETLNKYETMFNNFSAAEQGKELLRNKKEEILSGISQQIPFIIRRFRQRTLSEKLGFREIDFDDLYFPTYTFRYVSAGGNSSLTCGVVFDLNNLERFINYLSESIKFKKSIAGQRALMTSQLRKKIKVRDNYTCQKCGISSRDERHLLLEIDHIIPLSKGGLTTEDNLQTLCWKCNRSKGAKIEGESEGI